MSAPGMPSVTVKGYETYEVVSAMQKAVRRGDEELAMYWATELCETGLFYFAANRLRITGYEDIGLADVVAVQYANMALDFADKQFKNKSGWILPLANAVLALCRAKKSRLTDNFCGHMEGKRKNGWKPEMPDYALDKHTIRGKKMGRGIDHFLEVGAVLVPHEKMDKEDAYLQEAVPFWRSCGPKAQISIAEDEPKMTQSKLL